MGSPEIAVSLYRRRKISKEKATAAIHVLKRKGWFASHLIEKALEELK